MSTQHPTRNRRHQHYHQEQRLNLRESVLLLTAFATLGLSIVSVFVI